MTTRLLIILGAICAMVGCTGSTAVSDQPSEAEIQAGIDRRMKAIDDDPNMTPQAKQIAKDRIKGSSANSTPR